MPRQLHGGLFHLPGGKVRPLTQLFQPLGEGEHSVPALLDLPLLLGHLLPLLGDLPVGVLPGTGGLLDLPLQTVNVLPVVGRVVFQKACLPFPAHGLLVQGGGLGAGLLHLHRALVGLPVVFLRAPGDGLDLLFQLPVLGLHQGNLLPVLPQHFAGTVQGLQPDADLQAFFLLVVGDELLGLLRLDPQGLHPALQLGENVPQAHQVFLGLVQSPLRLLLPVTVAGDSRGFLENFPAVLGTGGHNAVDLALADDGITVPSQARVHKQLVDILQAHGVLVDEVLAFPGPVVPPGDGHRVPGKGQAPVGVVDGEGHLGKAQSFPLGGAVEDHVLHFGAAQGAHRLLSQHPAHGVADIAFAAAVGPHHRGDAPLELQGGLVGKGFEPLQLQRL